MVKRDWRIALGPNDSWVTWDPEGNGADWGRSLGSCWISNLMEGCYSRSDLNSGDKIQALSLGEGCHYYVKFQNGTSEWSLESGLSETVRNQENIHLIELGPGGSYIIMTDWHCLWRGVPDRAAELLKTKKNSTVVGAALGVGGGWYLKFADGKYYWGGWLTEENISEENIIDRVALSATSRNYFLEHADGSQAWRINEEFSNKNKPDIYYTRTSCIRYSNDSISDVFTIGGLGFFLVLVFFFFGFFF